MINSFVRSIGQQVQSWFINAPTMETDDELVELPDTIQAELVQKIQVLPSPEGYQSTVQEAIATAIKTWQQNLEASNHLVFLANPVEPIAKILDDSLQNWSDPCVEVITPLHCQTRPRDPLMITQQIQEALKSSQQVDTTNSQGTDDQLDAKSLEERKTLIVIPCLDQCFLRSIGGWEGIEYLRDIVIHNRNCFWVMGCNQWAWDFLDFVSHISAYFSEVRAIPEMDGAMLQGWLDPIVNTVIEKEALDHSRRDRSLDERRQSYWDFLASKSSGVSSIAANLWLQSLRVSQTDLQNSDQNQLNLIKAVNEQNITLHEISPFLPHLPSLMSIDRYLLHAVLIHGNITRAHLALTLGEPESQIQSHIQRLLREGILEQGNGALSVRAAHYSKLKTELANNNFFVGKD